MLMMIPVGEFGVGKRVRVVHSRLSYRELERGAAENGPLSAGFHCRSSVPIPDRVSRLAAWWVKEGAQVFTAMLFAR